MGTPRPPALMLLLASLILSGPPRAAADGKVFRPVQAADDPWIPDQRALLHWMEGEETLVIETSVNGGGQELTWVGVVPLPSVPEVEEAPAARWPMRPAKSAAGLGRRLSAPGCVG